MKIIIMNLNLKKFTGFCVVFLLSCNLLFAQPAKQTESPCDFLSEITKKVPGWDSLNTKKKEKIDSVFLQINKWVAAREISKNQYDSLKTFYNAYKAFYDNAIQKIGSTFDASINAEKSRKELTKNINSWLLTIPATLDETIVKSDAYVNNTFNPYLKKVETEVGSKEPITLTLLAITLGKIVWEQAQKQLVPWLSKQFEKLFKGELFNNKDKRQSEINALKNCVTENINKLLTMPKWEDKVSPFVDGPTATPAIQTTQLNSIKKQPAVKPNAGVQRVEEEKEKQEFKFTKPFERRHPNTSELMYSVGNGTDYLTVYGLEKGANIYPMNFNFQASNSFKIEYELLLNQGEGMGKSNLLLWNIVYSPLDKSITSANYLYLGNFKSKENQAAQLGFKTGIIKDGKEAEEIRSIVIPFPKGIPAKNFYTIGLQFNPLSAKTTEIFVGGKSLATVNNFSAYNKEKKMQTAVMNTLPGSKLLLKRAISQDESGENGSIAPPSKEEGSKGAPILESADFVAKISSNETTLRVLCVGVNKYFQGGEGGKIKNLNYAAKDAQYMKSMFSNMNSTNKDLVILTDYKATKKNIKFELEKMVQRSGPNDIFYFYYSGHGTNEAIVPTDVQVNDYSTCLTYSEILEIIGEKKMLAKIFILDCCHSGSLREDFGGAKGGGYPTNSESNFAEFKSEMNAKGKSTIGAICSSFADQLSYEQSGLGHGLFTYWLLNATITGNADSNKDKIITYGEMSKYLRANIPQEKQGVKAFGVKVKGDTPLIPVLNIP